MWMLNRIASYSWGRVCLCVLVARLSLKIDVNSPHRSVLSFSQPIGQSSDCYVDDIVSDTPAAHCGHIQVFLSFLSIESKPFQCSHSCSSFCFSLVVFVLHSNTHSLVFHSLIHIIAHFSCSLYVLTALPFKNMNPDFWCSPQSRQRIYWGSVRTFSPLVVVTLPR